MLATLLSAAIVGAATHVPGGLGVLEAVFIAALGGAGAAAQLIAALLAYRALYYLVPLVVAAAMHFALEAIARRRKKRGRSRAARRGAQCSATPVFCLQLLARHARRELDHLQALRASRPSPPGR